MPGFWQMTNRGTVGAAATATQSAPASGTNAGQPIRLRAIQATLSGTSAGADRLVVRDGASGVGTIVASYDLSVAANSVAILPLDNLDIRATAGNALTVEFVSGAAFIQEDVSAQGDFVSTGYPWGGL